MAFKSNWYSYYDTNRKLLTVKIVTFVYSLIIIELKENLTQSLIDELSVKVQ